MKSSLVCACGCGKFPKQPGNKFLPGHNSRMVKTSVEINRRRKISASVKRYWDEYHVSHPVRENAPCLCGCGNVPKTKGSKYWIGHCPWTDSHREQHGLIMRKRWRNKRYREETLTLRNSKAYRENLSAKGSQRMRDPVVYRKHCLDNKNRWKDPEFRKMMEEVYARPERSKLLSDYKKKFWASLSGEAKSAIICKMLTFSRPNKLEKVLARLLKKSFPGEFKLNVDGKFVIGGKVPDFVNVNGKKLLIELFGRPWHEDCEVPLRKKLFAKWGFKTAIIWTSELKKPDLVVAKVAKFMGQRP